MKSYSFSRKTLSIVAAVVMLFALQYQPGEAAVSLPEPIPFTPDVQSLQVTPMAEPHVNHAYTIGMMLEAHDPLPDVLHVYGDEHVGWGPIAGGSQLALIWITDKYGTHYQVVDRFDELLLGIVDPVTGDRLPTGFNQALERRTHYRDRLSDQNGQFLGSTAMGALAGAAIIVCAFTAGAGCVAVGLGIGLTAIGSQIQAGFTGLRSHERMIHHENNLHGIFLEFQYNHLYIKDDKSDEQ